MMPGMDGVETFKCLKEKPGYNQLPVVFMTAKVQTSEVKSYKDLGAVDVISKPFNPIELPERILGIWNRA
jgi:CheY-like chemotaxis protein